MFVENRQFEPTPPLYGTTLEVTPLETFFGARKQESLGYRTPLLT